MREAKPRTLVIALAAALGVHAMLASVGARLSIPRGPDAPLAPVAREPGTAEVDLVEDAAPAPAADDPGAPRAKPTPRAPGPRTAVAAGALRAREPVDDAPAPALSGGEGAYALDPGVARVDPAARVELGVAPGDWSRWIDPSAPAPRPPVADARPSVAAPVSTTGGIAEALEAHDREIGLGPQGAVLSAARDAGHTDVAPAIGTATFTITVMRAGGVEVELTSATSQADGWRQVAARMADALRRKPPVVREPRRGVRIGLELVAEERWPNGARAKGEGPSFAVRAPKLAVTDEAKEQLARRNPAAIPPPGAPVEQPSLKLDVEAPGVFVEGRGKVCSYALGLTVLGPSLQGGCDPSNVGASPTRVVSTRIVSQTML